MKTRIVINFVCALLIIFVGYKFVQSADYLNQEFNTKCILVDKLPIQTGGKHSRTELTFVLRNAETNKVFDLVVTPSTYSCNDKNDVLFFNLNRNELGLPNIYWNPGIYLLLGFVLCIGFIPINYQSDSTWD